MSREQLERAIEHLEALIVELGGLRNAGTRDPGFKAWRQNTLTAIQRFWPGDQTRSDRFRRVPFSPPSNKMSVKLTREFFERGCAEAVLLLRALVTEIREQGLPDPDTAPIAHGSEMSADVDFPMVDLPLEGEAPASPRVVATEMREFDETASPSPLQGRTSRVMPPAPEPPRREAPRGRAPENPLAPVNAPPPVNPQAPAKPERRKGSRLGSWARKNMKPRLKDMLGFTDESHDEPSAPEPSHEAPRLQHPQAPEPRVFEPPVHEPPVHEPPVREPQEFEPPTFEPTMDLPPEQQKPEPGTIVIRGS